MKPLVSVCIPTYNAARFILETLDSILSQSYSNIEIIIGDNCSTDNTKQIVQPLLQKNKRVAYYKNEKNLGYAGNCNKLIGLAKGKYVAIFHSDDIYDSKLVEKQVDLLEMENGLVGCFSLFSYIDEKSNSIERNQKIKLASDFKKYNKFDYIDTLIDTYVNPFFCPSSMIRKDSYIKAGMYDLNTKYVEDQDMWIRLLELGDLAVINEQLVKYRLHSGQGSTFYTDPERSEVSPMISQLKSYLVRTVSSKEYSDKYEKRINRMIAIDHLFLAYYMAKNGRFYLEYKNKIIKSREVYVLSLFDFKLIRFKLVQFLPTKISYLLINGLRR